MIYKGRFVPNLNYILNIYTFLHICIYFYTYYISSYDILNIWRYNFYIFVMCTCMSRYEHVVFAFRGQNCWF